VIAAVSMSCIERSLTVLSKLADQRGAEVARNARDREYKLKILNKTDCVVRRPLMQAPPGPEWQPKLKELVDLLLEREDAVTRRDPGASRFYDGLIRTLLQQLRDENAPLSLVGELLAGARAKRDLEKERQKVQELETKLREREYFDQYGLETKRTEDRIDKKKAVPENPEMPEAGIIQLELAELISAEGL
jgi:hypothetical protein